MKGSKQFNVTRLLTNYEVTRKLGNLIDHHLVRLVAMRFMILFFNCVSVEDESVG